MQFSQAQLDQILGVVVYDHTDDVKQMLRDNGISLPENVSQNEVAVAFLKGIKDSEPFRNYLSDYLTGMVQYEAEKSFVSQSGQYYNVSRSLDDTQTQNTTAEKQKSAFSQLFTGDNLSNLFNTGLTVLSTKLTEKSKAESEKRVLEAKQLELQKAAYEAQKAASEAKKGISTFGVIMIILGVAGLVIGSYFIFRKKK